MERLDCEISPCWNRLWPSLAPRLTVADLHRTIADKAAALGFALIANHPFIDGNKRVGHAAMEVFLVLNGLEIDASVGDQERVVLSVAAGDLDRAGLSQWLKSHLLVSAEGDPRQQ